MTDMNKVKSIASTAARKLTAPVVKFLRRDDGPTAVEYA